MRIATWNVNSLKARQDAVDNWLARAAPDILLLQETKLTDADAPVMSFAMAGYQLVHHGEGRWNGVAIAARDGLTVSDVVTNFGDGPVRDSGPGGAGADVGGEEDFDPFDEARMVAATVDGLAGRQPLRAERPGRRLAVLRGQAGLVRAARAVGRGAGRRRPPWSSVATSTWPRPGRMSGTKRRSTAARTSPSPSGRRSRRCSTWASSMAIARCHDEAGRFSWWDYRAGMFHKNFGMRIDHLLLGSAVAPRIVDAEIDRDARKGPPVPSDHAPLLVDLDEPGPPDQPRLGRRARPHQGPDQAASLRCRAPRLTCRGADDRVALDPAVDPRPGSGP